MTTGGRLLTTVRSQRKGAKDAKVDLAFFAALRLCIFLLSGQRSAVRGRV